MNTMVETSSGNDSPGSAPQTPLSRSDCQDLVQRIVTSEPFSKSERLPSFLLYICDRELRGLTEEITEQQIGVQVFNRPADYNPGDDNIVRNYAGQLRKRLDLYFAGEGAHEKIRIQIPRGGYVPVFQRLDSPPLPGAPETAGVPDKTHPQGVNQSETSDAALSEAPVDVPLSSSRTWNWRTFLGGFGLCALLSALFFVLFLRSKLPLAKGVPTPNPLWSALFTKDRETFIVPADSGLGILQNLTEQKTNLADYISGRYLSAINIRSIDPSNLEDLRSQRYTSIADVNIIAKLSRLPEVVPDRYVVRFARDLRMEDLQDGNAVLLGAIHTDPWVDLLQKQLNFQFVCETHVNHCSIVNSHPANGEKEVYENESQKPSHTTYGVVAYIPNPNQKGRILLIEGLNVAATQAAADTILDDAKMSPILKQARLPDGSLAAFELLIEATSVDAAALPSRIIATRFEH